MYRFLAQGTPSFAKGTVTWLLLFAVKSETRSLAPSIQNRILS